MSPSRPGRRLAGLAATLMLLALVAAVPASAQRSGNDPGDDLELHLDRIDPWAGPGRPLTARVRVRNHDGDVVQVTSVQLLGGSAIGTRSELQSRLTAPDPLAPQNLLGTAKVDGGRVVPAGGQTTLPALRFPLPESIGAGLPGAVVPIRFLVKGQTDAGPVERSLDTYVVYVSERVANPLRLSLLAPVSEPTHRTPDQVFVDADLARLLGPNGSLGGMVGELARPGAPPVSMAVDPEVVEEAQAMVANTWRVRPPGQAEPVSVPSTDPRSEAARVFLTKLRRAATRAGVPLNAFPYAAGDLVALVRNGLEADAFALIAKGRRDLEAGLGTAPDESFGWPTGGAVDPPTLKTLSAANINTVVVTQGLLPVDSSQTQNAPVPLGGGQTALVPDAGLSVAVTDRRAQAAPALYAQRVLAETAIAWLERPGGTSPKARGVLVAPPHSWRPSPSFFSALVRGMGSAPWLSMVPVQTLAATVPPGPDVDERTLAPYSQRLVDAELPGGYLSTVSSAKESLTSFRSTVGPSYAPLDQYSRDLYIAESAWYRRSAPRFRGVLYVRAVNDGISSVYEKVHVRDTAVTLTSRDGKIQVTTTNASDVPLTVRLRLSSPKVDIPEPVSDTITLAPKSGDTQLRQVRTRATGTFPVKVEVLTGDGRVGISNAEIVLRSTALNRVTLLLMVGALVFLFVWWVRRRFQLRAARIERGSS